MGSLASTATSTRRKWAVGLAVGVTTLLSIVLTLCLTACQPQTTHQEESTEPEPTEESPGTVINVNQTDNGDFPDTMINSEFLHTGKRGCTSCHADLYATIENLSPDMRHIWTYGPGYGQEARIDDCLTCHRLHGERTGPYLGDLLHAYHYNNEQFTDELNGNCWSCHATSSEMPADNANREKAYPDSKWMLFDEIKYSAELGGYPSGDSDGVIAWCESRGWEGGHLTEMSVDSEMNMELEFSQPISNEEDMFIVDNWKPYDGPASTTPIDMDEWTLTIEGANETKSFTYEDLANMPHVTKTVTQECYSIMPGSVFVGNFEVEGVLLSDLIEKCGGLPDGVNALTSTGHDGYNWKGTILLEDVYKHDVMIALKYWGHDLTEDQGYPATLAIPGKPGAPWVKWLENIEFKHVDSTDPSEYTTIDNYMVDSELFGNPVTGHPVSSSWFWVNDGDEFSMADGPVHLQGYSWAWYSSGNPLASVSFSFDYGNTWKTFEVPEGTDPYQWSVWDVDWTPPAPGTYVLKVKATDEAGNEQHWEDSVILDITE